MEDTEQFTEPKFNVGDFVWAKVPGYSYWPGIIVNPTELTPKKNKTKTRMYWTYFFGTHNFAWVRETFMKCFYQYKDHFKSNCTGAVKKACNELKWNEKQLKSDPNFKVRIADEQPQEARVLKSSLSQNSGPPRKRGRPKSDISRSRSRAKSARSTTASSRQSACSTRVTSRVGSSVVSRNDLYDNDIDAEISDDDDDELVFHRTRNNFAVGVFACNILAESFCQELISTKHDVHIWSSSQKLLVFLKKYAHSNNADCKIYRNPRDVVANCDIVFSMLSDKNDVKELLDRLGLCNESDYLLAEKIYVEMTTISCELSESIKNDLVHKRCDYLEAMVQGTKEDMEKNEAIVLVAGGKRVKKLGLKNYETCFAQFNKTIYVGRVPVATRIHGIFQMIKAQLLAIFTEALPLVEEIKELNSFFTLFPHLPISSNYFTRICRVIKDKKYDDIQETLPSLQKDLQEMLNISEKMRHPLPLASAANQLYKHARSRGLDVLDSSAMFLRDK